MNIRFTHLAKILFVFTFLFFAIENIAQTSQTITSTQNWTCPAGVTSVSVQAWGAGGGGGSNANGGGGGGGGAFRLNSSVTVIPGTTYTITIGNGGAGGTNANGSAGGITTATFGATTVTANGGSGGLSFGNGASGGAGGTGGTFNGGNGANGSSSQSGGGGGGAGTTTNGSAGSGITGGAGGSLNGGTGGNGTTANNANGSNGNTYGGGGGGSTRSSTGGSGANGAVILTYTCPTITVSAGPNQTLAACATTATLAGSAIPSGMTGTWTVVSGSASITTPTSPTSGITAIPQGSSVTLRWTISNGVCGSAFSDVTITTPLGPGCLTYCTPSTTTCSAVCVPGNFACYDIITNVTLGTLNNNSGTTTCAAGGYQNFTALSPPTLTIGLNHTIQITTGNAPGNHVAGVWIDYNQNGVLNDAGEYFEIGNAIGANATVNQTFQVPTTALLGNTRMRIRYVAALSLLSSHGCNTSATFGETEDYTVNIVCATASLNTVTGRFPANGLALPCGAATTLSWDAHTCATSGFDVYLGTTNPPTTLVASTSGTTYYTGNLLGNTTYFWRIVPKAGPSTGASTVWSFTTQTPINTAFSQDTSGCSGSTLCLQASGGTYPDYYWYNVPVNGTPIGTGSSYCPPAITTPTTFYVSNVFQGPASSIATATASGIVCGSNNPSNGNMFDIQAKTANLNITALEVMFRNLGTGGSGTRTAKVYYRQSSFVGNASSSAGWILLGTYSVTVPNSPTAPTFIDIADFFVPAGQIYGVYVVYDNDYASGANVYSNVDIEVRTGSSLCGAGSEFAGEIPDRSFRGRVYYNITCSSPTIPVVATPWTSNGLVALTPVTRTGLTERCVENGWTYYSHSSAPNQWLFAINKNGNNFTATADVTVGSPANNVYENVNAPGQHGSFLMRRYWNVNVTSGSINPAQPVSVRFFFDTNEAAWAINRRNTVRTASYPSTFATAWRWFKNTTGAYVPTANVDGNIFLFPNVTLTPAGSLSVLGIAPYTGTINSVAHVDLGGITSFSGGTGGLGFTPINGGILPVELINFEGKEAERANQLVWSTASEKNNDYYVVESSLDGMSFSPIGTVKGAGTSNQLLKYSLNDYNYYMPGTYYRLKQVDFDGEFTYSNVIFISRKSTVQFKANVYPNPTDGRLTLNTTTPVGGIAKVNIYNSLGQSVFASDISFSEGVTTTEFNLVELPSGLYMIEVNGLEEKAVFKFTKR